MLATFIILVKTRIMETMFGYLPYWMKAHLSYRRMKPGTALICCSWLTNHEQNQVFTWLNILYCLCRTLFNCQIKILWSPWEVWDVTLHNPPSKTKQCKGERSGGGKRDGSKRRRLMIKTAKFSDSPTMDHVKKRGKTHNLYFQSF